LLMSTAADIVMAVMTVLAVTPARHELRRGMTTPRRPAIADTRQP
jgi:hypothetical protein